MEREKIKELKDVASKAVCQMIDKMFIETDVNDSAIAVNIIGHDIKGYEVALNQYSCEININGNITVSLPKFIRYPEYFGKAVRNSIRKFNEENMQKVRDIIAKDAIERSEGVDDTIWDRLRAMEDGLRTLESTGFSPESIQRIVDEIRTGVDSYAPVPVEDISEPTDEPGDVAQNVRRPTEHIQDLTIEERAETGEVIAPPREYIPEDDLPLGYTPAELRGDINFITTPQNDRQRAQAMIREYLRGMNLDIEYINEHHRRELIEMADFEDIPQNFMILSINEFNGDIDEQRRLNLHNEMENRRAADNAIPGVDEIIETAQEMDRDDTTTRNIHDDAAVRFIETWYNNTMENIDTIDQRDYQNMLTHIEAREVPGVYIFALDRVIGAHNAAVTSGRVGEVEITAHTVLEGTPHRISTIDAAYRLFAHITGCNNPDIDSIGRYVNDEMRQELYNSAHRNNIPQEDINSVIQMYNGIHRNQSLRGWEDEESRKSDIFILSHYNNDHIINDTERLELISHAELFNIDTQIFISRLDEHSRLARGIRQEIIREADEIDNEDLRAASDRYDQLVRESITDLPDRDPHNDDDRT